MIKEGGNCFKCPLALTLDLWWTFGVRTNAAGNTQCGSKGDQVSSVAQELNLSPNGRAGQAAKCENFSDKMKLGAQCQSSNEYPCIASASEALEMGIDGGTFTFDHLRDEQNCGKLWKMTFRCPEKHHIC